MYHIQTNMLPEIIFNVKDRRIISGRNRDEKKIKIKTHIVEKSTHSSFGLKLKKIFLDDLYRSRQTSYGFWRGSNSVKPRKIC